MKRTFRDFFFSTKYYSVISFLLNKTRGGRIWALYEWVLFLNKSKDTIMINKRSCIYWSIIHSLKYKIKLCHFLSTDRQEVKPLMSSWIRLTVTGVVLIRIRQTLWWCFVWWPLLRFDGWYMLPLLPGCWKSQSVEDQW